MKVERLEVQVAKVPTPSPESDGTAEWGATTIVIALARAGGATGLGYSYVDASAATVIRDLFAERIVGLDVMATGRAMRDMLHAIRNHGRAGIGACAISAVDIALWDLKARVLGVPLAALLGAVHDRVPVYASGGFTSTPPIALAGELAGYVAGGHRRVKIKIGRDQAQDVERVRVAREVLGPAVELMVDANGAYARKQALQMADLFGAAGVVYFEEPVSSDDLEGLRLVRDRADIAIAAGEYGYDTFYFRRMLDAGAVDILQADATRCLGVTGFVQAAALAGAANIPLSSHCGPSIHAHLDAAVPKLAHLEYFRDHVRVEHLLFDGVLEPVAGELSWNPRAPGLGLSLRAAEARRFAA